MWIGTEGGGLARFDGREFITYTIGNGLPDNTIRSLFEDADGNLWIGTDGHGLCKYDGKRFVTYDDSNGLSNNYIRCITQGSNGDIWIGTYGGGINRLRSEADSVFVSVFDKGTGTIASDKVRASLRDSKGTLWFGTDEGLYSTDGNSWKRYSKESGLSHNRILVLFEDLLQNLWIGTESGVNKMTEGGFLSFSESDGLIDNRIRGIGQDDLGNLWFGTQQGVTRFNGDDFLSFTEKNGLSNDRIRYITRDRSGNMWFGTYFGGICRFSGEEFIHFTEKDGITNDQVLAIFNHEDGDTWLGTLEGITELRPNSDGTWHFEKDPLGARFAGRSVQTIVKAPNNEIWFGTASGILTKKEKSIRPLVIDGREFTESIKAILFEPDGALWIGTDQGVNRFLKTDKGYEFDQYHSNPNFNESEVSSLFLDKFGRVWIGYLNARIVHFKDGFFEEIDAPKNLNNVAGFTLDRNKTLWVATEGGGLFRHQLSPDPIVADQFTEIGIDQGLSSTDIHQLVVDLEGNLWAGTAAGIDVLSLNNRSEVKGVKHYGMSMGFIGIETNENAATLDNDGKLWFGTIRGATRYDHRAKRKQFVENKLHITKIDIEFEDGEDGLFAKGDEGYFNLPVELELPFSRNNLTIEYTGINLRTPEHVRYQWKLEGFSDEWSEIEDKNYKSFTNLKPRSYTFLVRSVNGDGVWNQQPASFTFTVLPPFWMEWWFILICAILLIFIVRAIIKLRERRLLAEKQKLQEKVDERTAELLEEKERSDELLLNILPFETAEELKKNGYASVQQYDMVSVLFTDFVGFTNITEGITHQELVRSLDEHFRMFDEIMDKYRIEKIKTIGDAYMAAGGIPTRTVTNPLAVVAAGLEMIHRLQELNRKKELKGEKAWQLRLGIHTGSVISGVVGKNKFAFDIWGDAVNTAARMESSGEVMKVNISGATYQLVKDYFVCSARGKIKAKNKGEIEMYFVERLKPEFSGTDDGFVPNAVFLEQIRRRSENISMLN
jgi:ligand-binding sensor domain-containing protein/class 3 adenylate cyclase